MFLIILAAAALLFAALPALLFWVNLRYYQSPPNAVAGHAVPRVSVLIPARNEEQSIGDALAAALAGTGVELEVIVLDDHSEDSTARIVRQLAATDDRVRLISSPDLPEGWCGKQHACWTLSQHASHDLFVFVDADVRLAADGLARLVAFQQQSGAALVSGIPYQETMTLLERLVIPLIHFVLLGFLPIRRMRASCLPAYAAGCGQLFLAQRLGYEKCLGHSAIRTTMHDGIKLPRAFRESGLMTDLCDATSIARCRMYRNRSELWHGLAKNATEGLGSPALIVPSTLVLLLGQVMPSVLLVLSIGLASDALFLAVPALLCSYYPRLAGVARFKQSLVGALLHPVGILILLAIQWYALLARALGRPRGWKGRAYPKKESSDIVFAQPPAKSLDS